MPSLLFGSFVIKYEKITLEYSLCSIHYDISAAYPYNIANSGVYIFTSISLIVSEFISLNAFWIFLHLSYRCYVYENIFSFPQFHKEKFKGVEPGEFGVCASKSSLLTQ